MDFFDNRILCLFVSVSDAQSRDEQQRASAEGSLLRVPGGQEPEDVIVSQVLQRSGTDEEADVLRSWSPVPALRTADQSV